MSDDRDHQDRGDRPRPSTSCGSSSPTATAWAGLDGRRGRRRRRARRRPAPSSTTDEARECASTRVEPTSRVTSPGGRRRRPTWPRRSSSSCCHALPAVAARHRDASASADRVGGDHGWDVRALVLVHWRWRSPRASCDAQIAARSTSCSPCSPTRPGGRCSSASSTTARRRATAAGRRTSRRPARRSSSTCGCSPTPSSWRRARRPRGPLPRHHRAPGRRRRLAARRQPRAGTAAPTACGDRRFAYLTRRSNPGRARDLGSGWRERSSQARPRGERR